MTAMFLRLIFGLVAMLTGAFATVLVLLILGIRQGDREKRLTGQPGSRSEMLARRVLTGSRGCTSRNHPEEGQ
jgi:putative exporter of polyketide antibiotics